MNTITAIEDQKRRKDRVNIFLGGSFAFSLERMVVQEQGLHLGQMLSDSQIDKLTKAEIYGKCLEAAFRLLSYRPRSEAEIRRRLGRRFEKETIDRVVLHLKERQIVDDGAFARFWTENRESFSPRSRRLIKRELRSKGIDSEVADEVLEGIDDEESAYRAAQRKGRNLGKDYEIFRQKLGAFLGRRGFSYDIINRTIERLWQELS
jgi:regulatory protein